MNSDSDVDANVAARSAAALYVSVDRNARRGPFDFWPSAGEIRARPGQ